MTAETPGRDAVFCAAVEIPSADERAAYIARACGDDAEWRAQIEKLVDAHFRAGSFLEEPVPGATGPLASPPSEAPALAERPGTIIGPYKLLEQIGEGGFGVVFMAEQQAPIRRKVALKVLKPGMDTRQVVARFEAERQALAIMDHPHIARVFDGGATSSGRPYFVMELVKGAPITDFCDQNRLTPRQRLELFMAVCQAVQHAHQKGVIHRDLKPSNVLVTVHDTTPVVKVIDFGVAKALGQELTDKTLFTGFAQMVGTPLYMSPEQAGQSGLDADTRSDVYSLGVLLYELLTGTTPFTKERFRRAGYDEIRRIIREEEPPRPSTRISTLGKAATMASARQGCDPKQLSRLIRGELDWIVMKSLEKDRNRRYETANGLARDVERYLRDEPVQACPPSAGYRLRKFARRNKAGLGIAGLILLGIVLAGAGGGWLLRDRAARQRDADGRALEALKGAEPRLGDGRPWDPTLVLAVQRVEAELESGSLGPEVRRRAEQLRQDMRMLVELDEIRLRQAESKDGQMFDSAGSAARYRAAFSAYGLDVDALEPAEAAARIRSSAIREALVAGLDAWMQVASADGTEKARLRAIADGADDNAWRRTFRKAALAGDAEQLKSLADRALAFQGAHALAAGDMEKLKALAGQPEALALPPSDVALLGAVLEGAGAANEAVALLRKAQGYHPEDFWLNYNLGHVLLFKPSIHSSDEAVGYFRAAVAVRPGSAEAHSILGLALLVNGDTDGAIAAYREAITLDPKFVIARDNLANALLCKGDYSAAVDACSECIRLQPDFSEAWAHRGQAYAHLKQWDKALAEYSEAIKLDPKNAEAWLNRGQALNESGQPEKAIADYSKVLELPPENAVAWMNRGQAYTNLGQWDKALAALNRAVELGPMNAGAWVFRGMALAHLRRYDEALADYSHAIELDPKQGWFWQKRGEIHYGLHQYEKAVADCSMAVEWDPKLAWAWCYRCFAHRQLLQWDEALADVSKALQLEPDTPAFQGILAWHLATHPDATKRDPRRAVELAGRSVQAAPTDLQPWHVLGVARYRIGDGPGAVAALQEALKLPAEVDDEGHGPWFVRGHVLFFLAMAQQKIGHGSEAREAYERALAWLKTQRQELEWNPGNADEFRRFQAEAEETLGVPPSAPPGKEKER